MSDTIESLRAQLRAAEEDGQRDLAEMRRFQALYIKADHARLAAEEAQERAERDWKLWERQWNEEHEARTAAEGALREAREVCLDASLAFLSMHQQSAAARADNAVRAIDRLLGKPSAPPPETP